MQCKYIQYITNNCSCNRVTRDYFGSQNRFLLIFNKLCTVDNNVILEACNRFPSVIITLPNGIPYKLKCTRAKI